MARGTSKVVRFGTLMQRQVSLLTGEARPVTIQHGVVGIGNRSVTVTTAREFSSDQLEHMGVDEWNKAKQAQRQHECAAAQMGMMCGHA